MALVGCSAAHRVEIQFLFLVFLDQIFETPFVHIDGKHSFVDQAAAKRSFRIRILEFFLKVSEQSLPNPVRDSVRSGINVVK